ncbi:hypothetical protein L7F22_023682 [Adiantum nelumboides]|nr:hypothetical protein [Adiantum nelumboides]
METFQQLSKHPKMQELLQASKSPTQTQKASSQSLQSPRQTRSGHLQRKETSKEQRSNDTKRKGHVVEQPLVSIGHRQPSTHGLVNGQDSNEQTMRQTIPLPMSNAGCFGGGSVFQAMIRPSPALHGFMPDNAYGAMPPCGSNPLYGNIDVQPGFECAAGSYGMPGANMGMAGFSQPDAQNLNMAGRPGVKSGSGMPLLNAPAYDNLTPQWYAKFIGNSAQLVRDNSGRFQGLKQVPRFATCNHSKSFLPLTWKPLAMQYCAESVPEEDAGTRLSTKKCVPCNSKNLRPMNEESARLLSEKVPGWNLVNDDGQLKLEKSWKVKNFMKGIEFCQKIGDVAEAEGHHPNLHVENWNDVRVEIRTHAVGGLTENDFILAAKINDLNLQEYLRKSVSDAKSSGCP